MNTKIIGISVAAVIGIIVLGSVLMPILDDATETERTFTNDGLWRMKEFETGDTWVMSSPGVWTLNGESVLTTDNTTSSLMIGDDWTVRGTGAVYGHTVYNASPSTLTITVGESSTTINNNTVDSTEGYGVANDGDYIVTKYDTPVYVLGDSPIWATGYTSFSGVSAVIHIEGNINDGVTVSCSTINNTTALSNFEVTNIVIHADEEDKYDDLYRLEKITFTVTCDYTAGGTTTQKTGDVSYSSYVVPYEVTADRSVQFTSGQNAILAAIPVMIILAILLGVVALVLRSRID